MIIQFVGGLGLFLFGLNQMGEALKNVAGDRMRQILGKLTANRFMGLVTGTLVTAIVQSSSVMTVMLVGFVSAGLMSLPQAIGVILGADIGTTITAQIIAFPIKEYALLPVAVGFFLLFTSKRNHVSQSGVLIMGLGLVFFGIALMSGAMKPLRSYQPFLDVMQHVTNPLVAILVSTVFTALIQASAATMGIVIVFASQGMISLEAGIALTLGANIGTCATAGLAALGKPREAVRVAIAHVTFKVVGVLLIVWFIPPFADLVRSISPVSEHLTGADRLASDTPRQIANAHTLFNVGIGLLFLPFVVTFARMCEWIVPDRMITDSENYSERIDAKYLDDVLLDTPSLALQRAQLEIGRLGDRVCQMYEEFLQPTIDKNTVRLVSIAAMKVEIDALYGKIVNYLSHISARELPRNETDALMRLVQAVNQLENIGDLIVTNLIGVGQKLVMDGVTIGPVSRRTIRDYHKVVGDALRDSNQAFRDGDAELARQVRKMKRDMTELAGNTVHHALDQMITHEPKRLQTYKREMELVENLTRIYRHSRRLAGLVPSGMSG